MTKRKPIRISNRKVNAQIKFKDGSEQLINVYYFNPEHQFMKDVEIACYKSDKDIVFIDIKTGLYITTIVKPSSISKAYLELKSLWEEEQKVSTSKKSIHDELRLVENIEELDNVDSVYVYSPHYAPVSHIRVIDIFEETKKKEGKFEDCKFFHEFKHYEIIWMRYIPDDIGTYVDRITESIESGSTKYSLLMPKQKRIIQAYNTMIMLYQKFQNKELYVRK